MKRYWTRLSGPVKIGLAVGLIGALLTVIGLFTGNLAPLTLRSLLLGIPPIIPGLGLNRRVRGEYNFRLMSLMMLF